MVAMANNSSVMFHTLMYVLNQSIIQDEGSYNYYFMKIGKETNAKKCYGMYGCFELSSPWTSEHRPVSLFPMNLVDIEPNYFLHTRQNRVKPTLINLNEYDYVSNTGMDPEKPIYVVTHGYMEGGSIDWFDIDQAQKRKPNSVSAGNSILQSETESASLLVERLYSFGLVNLETAMKLSVEIFNIAQKLLDMEDCNVIVVDWHGGSSPPYAQAVANIRLIGAMTAHLLYDIAQCMENPSLKHVHGIGHSLGSHLLGYAGYTLQDEFNLTLGRITGMDPAEPHFAKTGRPVRLDRSAATYVDIIHTDASQFIRGGLGISESIGHVDYFPNGGSNQPGCGKSVVEFIHDQKGSFFHGMKKYLGCNHERAHQIFLESINPKCTFLSIRCTSYQDFVDGKCWDCGKYGERCLKFGHQGRKHYAKFYGDGMDTSLNQFLITGSSKPYCMGHYRVIVKVADTEDSKKHGGEIGQLMFTMHSTTDGSGSKSSSVGFVSGYYEPGGVYMKVIAAEEVKSLQAVELEWKYNSSLFNPLTWRFLTTPKIYLQKITVESLENQQRITICPKAQQALINGEPKLMIPTYC